MIKKYVNFSKNNTSGITLIALIVTIIVLIILAGIAIAMLRGDNGILNRATESKYLNVISTFDEETKLAQMDSRALISSNRVSKKGYIATTENNMLEIATSVAKDIGVTVSKTSSAHEPISREKYTVAYYLTDTETGSSSNDGNGYIVIWYSNNSLRSTMDRNDAITRGKLIDKATNKSVNQAALAAVIHVENYNCTLSKLFLTSTTDADSDIKKESFSDTTLANDGEVVNPVIEYEGNSTYEFTIKTAQMNNGTIRYETKFVIDSEDGNLNDWTLSFDVPDGVKAGEVQAPWNANVSVSGNTITLTAKKSWNGENWANGTQIVIDGIIIPTTNYDQIQISNLQFNGMHIAPEGGTQIPDDSQITSCSYSVTSGNSWASGTSYIYEKTISIDMGNSNLYVCNISFDIKDGLESIIGAWDTSGQRNDITISGNTISVKGMIVKDNKTEIKLQMNFANDSGTGFDITNIKVNNVNIER